jgi:DNA-binding LacI/PurR family transcriptional regulator
MEASSKLERSTRQKMCYVIVRVNGTFNAMSRTTILDVAAKAGVSKSLVSLVMQGAENVSEEKRNRVLAAAEELGYRPNAAARSLVRRRSNLFGVLLSDLHNPFFAEVIDGVQAEAAERGYRAIICSGDRVERSEEQALETLLELRMDGLILASPVLDMDVIAKASDELPTVLVARHAGVPTVDSVANDDRSGAELAINHLVQCGHQRIAHIDGGQGAGALERRLGYENAMRRAGLDRHIHVVQASFTEDGGRQGAKALLECEQMPTAIFASNDLAAVGALGFLADKGIRVPEDISIVGYDNTALASLRHINLTTVNQPRPDMGRAAVTLLLERLESRREIAQHLLIPPTLVVRGTTAPPA